jgi:hypothetical protein
MHLTDGHVHPLGCESVTGSSLRPTRILAARSGFSRQVTPSVSPLIAVTIRAYPPDAQGEGGMETHPPSSTLTESKRWSLSAGPTGRSSVSFYFTVFTDRGLASVSWATLTVFTGSTQEMAMCAHWSSEYTWE